MNRIGCFLALAGVVFLAGCATTESERGGTHSPRGVGVSGVPETLVRETLVQLFSQAGYTLEKSDRRSLSFDQPASKWKSLIYGTSFIDPETYVRIKVRIMDVGPADWWIGYESLFVTERGSVFERETNLGKASRIQDLLESWKAESFPPDP